jgi:hypothetical protein
MFIYANPYVAGATVCFVCVGWFLLYKIGKGKRYNDV